MALREKQNIYELAAFFAEVTTERVELRPKIIGFDPELLYVECHVCGKPVLWEKGKTTGLLLAAGVSIETLDERCMILSEGCPLCKPEEEDGFTLAVVRLAGVTPEEAAYMSRPAGRA